MGILGPGAQRAKLQSYIVGLYVTYKNFGLLASWGITPEIPRASQHYRIEGFKSD